MKLLLLSLLLLPMLSAAKENCLLHGTGELAVVVERARGSVKIFDTRQYLELFRVAELGDLSHASVVFSQNQRYAYIFGRDGGLSKVDLLCGVIDKRILQAGNSIGGAISQNGRWIAVSNYQPGGIKIFDAENLQLAADIPAEFKPNTYSKTVGLVDAPGNRFIYSLFEGSEIHVVQLNETTAPNITRYSAVGLQPYDGLITPDGRYYLAGLFGEDGFAKLDLWQLERGVHRILPHYGRGQKRLPVYKMPHLEAWAVAGAVIFLPAIGQHRVLVVDRSTWQQVASIPVKSQPVFVVAQPDGRRVWVNFAYPDNHQVQVIDSQTKQVIKTLDTGPATLHMEFTGRGHALWLSVRDRDEVQVYDTYSFQKLKTLNVDKPSGIFFSSRAHKIGL